MSDNLISNRQIWRVLTSRALLILLTAVLTVVVALLVTLRQPKLYTAEAVVLVEYNDPASSAGGQAAQNRYQPDYMQTQLGILTSRRVADQAVTRVIGDGFPLSSIVKISEGDDLRPDPNLIQSLVIKAAELIPGVEPDPAIIQNLPEPSTLGPDDDRNRATYQLLSGVSARLDNSRLMNIVYTASDPGLSASVANAFADSFVQTRLELSRDPARQTADWFEGQLAELRGAVENAQRKLSEYQQEKQIVSSDNRVDVEIAHLNALTSQLVAAQAEVATSDSRYAQLDSVLRNGQGSDTMPEIISNRVIQDLKVALVRKRSELSELSATFGEKHPNFLNIRAEVSQLEASLDAEMAAILQGVKSQRDVAQNRERSLQQALATQKAKLLNIRSSRDDLPVLMNEVENAQRNYEEALRDSQKFTLLGRLDQTNALVLTRASAPRRPSSPRLLRNLGAALVSGLILGLLCAFLLEVSNRRVRHSDDLEFGEAGPVLAEIPRQ